ncbi:hypothetical protein AKJ09_03916 [Labilithrix luteola]|uniref:Uncharacterized protein n=1 Tax=Labilithrix luteola TaxID=1391654 RepID=A0A0K1PUQ7_9BACT|nr:hypothetical protein AKJ09_03916 [Labilithrix luteola]
MQTARIDDSSLAQKLRSACSSGQQERRRSRPTIERASTRRV